MPLTTQHYFLLSELSPAVKWLQDQKLYFSNPPGGLVWIPPKPKCAKCKVGWRKKGQSYIIASQVVAENRGL